MWMRHPARPRDSMWPIGAVFKGGSRPRAPDPAATAAAQAQANKEAVRESALVSQIGINSPWGRQFYTGQLGEPDRALNIELTPTGQETLGYQEQLANLISQYGAETLGPSVTERLGAGGSTAADALYERGLARLEPEYDEAEELLRSRLMSQGIPVGSRAYEQSMGRFGRQRADAMENLALSSEIGGFAEDRAQRSQAINELAALLQGAPAIGAPPTQLPAQYQIASPDIAGLTAADYAGRLNAYNTDAQRLGGLYGLAGTLGAATIGGLFG